MNENVRDTINTVLVTVMVGAMLYFIYRNLKSMKRHEQIDDAIEKRLKMESDFLKGAS